MTVGVAKPNGLRLVAESSCGLSVWSCSAHSQAIARGPLLPTWYVPRRASRRESGGPGGPPFEGVARSAPCAADGSRRRDPPSPLRIPPGYDAPRTRASLGRFGRLESYPCLQQPSPLAPSLTSSPPAIAPCLVLVRHSSADAEAHRRIEFAGGCWRPVLETTNAPSESRSRGRAARNTHVRSSPLSGGATTNQGSRPPRPPRRTRTGPCRPYTAPVTSTASTLRSARCSRPAAVKTSVQYTLAPRIPQWYACCHVGSRRLPRSVGSRQD
jgi:hypothetical protein